MCVWCHRRFGTIHSDGSSMLLYGGFKKRRRIESICVFKLVVISGLRVKAMLQVAVCARSNYVHKKHTEVIPETALQPNSAHTTHYSTDLCSYTFDIVPFLTLFVWQHIIYFTLEINYFSENRWNPSVGASIFFICRFVFLESCSVQHFHFHFKFCSTTCRDKDMQNPKKSEEFRGNCVLWNNVLYIKLKYDTG